MNDNHSLRAAAATPARARRDRALRLRKRFAVGATTGALLAAGGLGVLAQQTSAGHTQRSAQSSTGTAAAGSGTSTSDATSSSSSTSTTSLSSSASGSATQAPASSGGSTAIVSGGS